MRVVTQFRMRCFSMQLLSSLLIGISLVFSLSIGADAQTIDHIEKEKERAFEECSVKNFGKVNDHLFRGGQPTSAEYKQLAKIGVKMVIDLREDSEDYARVEAQSAGMKYINLRLSSKRPPTQEESNLFLRLV